MKFAVLFSGQGAQKPGMGIDFMSDPLFKETIEAASKASQQDILVDFKSEHNELKKTINVQPALVSFEAGIFQMLKRDLPDLDIAGMAGLSLGEYGAMFASAALNLNDTISLVSDRAKYMQADSDKVDNGMTALVKPDLVKVRDILADLQPQGLQVFLSNYNSPRQVVIGGEKTAVSKATQRIKDENAALKAISLHVNGAFHTPLFDEASKKMHERLKEVTFNQSNVPVISNTTVKPFSDDWSEIMERQLAVPTHFGDCLQYLIDHEGIEATLEIGPGKILSTFAKQIDRKLKRYQIGTLDEYHEFIEEENGSQK